MLNAAIIGVGRWGQGLVSSVQGKSDDIRFVAGVTRTKSKAEAYCKENDIDLRDSYDQIISDPDIDAVVLATPHTFHEEQIIAAAKAGKHVFTEKPFCLGADAAARAVAACGDAGVTVAVGHNRRFMANTEAMKAMIEAGELGTLLHIDGNQSTDLGMAAGAWRDSRSESPLGGMTSLGIHALDCMIHMGGRIAEIDCYSTRRAIGFDIDDTTAALVRFEDGMTGTLVTLASTARIFHLRVCGSKGWAEIRDNRHLTVCTNAGEAETSDFGGDAYPHPGSLAAELNEFARAAAGKTTYRVTPEEMIHGIEVLDAMEKSVETGGRVNVSG
jgi:predicted dehydrogenase